MPRNENVAEQLRAAEDRFEKIFEASPIAISISTLADGLYLDVNPTFARLAGYTNDEIVGRTSAELGIWREPLDRQRMIDRLKRDGILEKIEVEYRTKEGRVGIALCSFVQIEVDGQDCLLGLATDITERTRAERRLQLLQQASRSIAETDDLTTALVHALREICVATGWRYGECWLPARDGDRLVLGGAWHLEDDRLVALHRIARRLSLGPGEALPGRVWRSGVAAWIPDLRSIDHPHAEEARLAGLQSAVGIPAIAGRVGVGAVLVFYMDGPRERDSELIELVSAVGAQLGGVIRRRRAERALGETLHQPRHPEDEDSDGAQEIYAKALRASSAPMIVATLDEGRILDVSSGFESAYGYDRHEIIGRTEAELDLWVDPAQRAVLATRLRHGRLGGELPVQLRTRRGDIRDVLYSAETLVAQPGECVVAVLQDVTQRRRFERQLRHQALHDPLTGLPNRILLEDRIRHALARSRRQASRIGVVTIDIDRFHVVNDSLSHAAGDRLLLAVTRRLSASLREHDSVARLGGDEFGILLEDLPNTAEARSAAERITRAFEAPFVVQATEVHLAASIGLALSSPRLCEPEDLLRSAAAAMHRAKQERGTSVQFHQPELDRAAGELLQLENDLRAAISEEKLIFHYQPIVSLRGGGIEAAEALIRWDHPDRGLLLPGEFFQLADDTGLVYPLGEWVVRASVSRLEAWRRAGIVSSEFRLAFNLSPQQFHRPGLVDLLAQLLRDSEVPPSCLQVEVTETEALKNPEAIAELRRLGLHLAIDDVGTGYSSLENLARLEVDALKIDRTFISGLVEAPREDAIVETLVLLARRLGIPVVAEGVETIVQLQRLRELGCAYAQGFFFSKPLDPAVFEALLARSPRW